MAGTWIATVLGFGGMQVIDGELHLDPTLAPGWTELGFQVQFRGAWLSVSATPQGLTIENRSEVATALRVGGQLYHLSRGGRLDIAA